MWNGFASAVIALELATGRALLEPAPPGDVGVFPFPAPVHIITAYNPAGVETDDDANITNHRLLGDAVAGLDVIASVGSAPDGSMAEPGFALLGVPFGDALRLARRFGQRAFYRWTPEALIIVGVDEPVRHELGWRLSEIPSETPSPVDESDRRSPDQRR
jgi:hypothetical protein